MLAIRENRHNEPAVAKDPKKIAKSELVFESADVLESGMSGGKTSVTFSAIDPETGERYIIQTSVGILQMLMGAVSGMEQRWAAEPVPNIWKR